MNQQLQWSVESAIALATGTSTEIVSSKVASGGCIHQSSLVTTVDGRSFFVKSNQSLGQEVFAAEAAGLQALRETRTIRIPEVIVLGETESGAAFLILEAIPTGSRGPGFFARLGEQLAEMHRAGSSDRFGFDHDNFLGSTAQVNAWSQDWLRFWIDQRIEFQLRLASDHGFGKSLNRLADRFLFHVEKLLGGRSPLPALIHGDLWSGNYLAAGNGEPVLIDPAVYFADREAEFGMTTLFGGMSQDFYEAYHSTWPLEEGWEERVEIYRLYHLLNHLNLFGESYLGQCLDMMNR